MIGNISSSGVGRLTAALAALLMVVLVASCSDDAEEVPGETSSASTTRTTVATTTAVSVPTTTEPTTTTSTTVAFPSREVLDYLEEVRAVTVGLGELVTDMRAANNDWDNRSETGVSYADTEIALEDVEERSQDLREAIGVIEPPSDRGLPVEHRTAWVAVGQMADAAGEALAGLRSPDTGERRRSALAEFLVAFERFNGAVDRIVEIIGVGAGISAPTTTSTTAAPTTTSTTEAATTTSTTAAPATTSTTAAPTTTSTTEASATTSSTTVPPAPDIGYSVIAEGDSSSPDAKRVWLTVQVEAGITKSQLARVGARLAAEFRLSREYQALLIYFVHFPEGIDTLGTWIDAPFRDWNRAAEVEKGDYSQHQTDDRTVEKDWSQLPTEAQMNLYRAYTDYRSTQEDPEGLVPPDDEFIPLAAEELGVTADQIEDAIEAWEAWIAG